MEAILYSGCQLCVSAISHHTRSITGSISALEMQGIAIRKEFYGETVMNRDIYPRTRFLEWGGR